MANKTQYSQAITYKPCKNQEVVLDFMQSDLKEMEIRTDYYVSPAAARSSYAQTIKNMRVRAKMKSEKGKVYITKLA